MSSVIDLVTSQLLDEVKQEYKKHRELSSRLLSVLNCVFGQPLLSALDLVDRNAVTHIFCNTGKDVYQVCGSSGRVYTCPSSLQFCPCLSYSFGVMKRGELLMCKHLLAIHLCKAMETCREEEKTDLEITNILFQQEY